MASIVSHAVAAAAIGAAPASRRLPVAVWGLGIVWSIVPDIDVIGFQLGVPYGAPLGHRGLTHSLAFAAVIATLAVWLHQWRGALSRKVWRGAWTYLVLAAASHGVLDAMTNGGLGIAFFAPFSNTRYFLPWRPIAVSPIGLAGFFSRHPASASNRRTPTTLGVRGLFDTGLWTRHRLAEGNRVLLVLTSLSRRDAQAQSLNAHGVDFEK